jgi:hypothetical protein
MTARTRLLERLNLSSGIGLEVGALDRPVIAPDHPGILYADHLGNDALRHKYATDPNVAVGRLVPVHLVWDGSTALLDLLPSGQRLAYVVASHVIEHVPDPVGWLLRVHEACAPGATIGLVIPDARFTFDCRRRLTSLPDLLEAYHARWSRPSFRQVLDHFLHKTQVPECCSPKQLWDDPASASAVPLSHPDLLRELGAPGLRAYYDAIAAGRYIDAHCSVFTPDSFAQNLHQLATLNLLPFSLEWMLPTRRGEQEFAVVLRADAAPPSA